MKKDTDKNKKYHQEYDQLNLRQDLRTYDEPGIEILDLKNRIRIIFEVIRKDLGLVQEQLQIDESSLSPKKNPVKNTKLVSPKTKKQLMPIIEHFDLTTVYESTKM